ncbi:thiazolylpeptide-type bacteriocin, partial [Nocardiopsis alba]|uniref:thiazolylpeptide-type bacteriocin n=1 Tax=Nocardiopsis alba TaxID=53437 RepID=UPI00362F7AF0
MGAPAVSRPHPLPPSRRRCPMATKETAVIDLPELDFDDMEVMSVREAVAVPETGATSGSS